MAETESDQKTEAPTEKRKREAVDKGDILQSRELAIAVIMLGAAGWLLVAGPWFVSGCLELLRDGLSFNRAEIADFDPASQTSRLLSHTIYPLASLFGVAMLAVLAAPAMLGALGFRSQAIGFKMEKLNPATGLGRMFGLNALIELGKALAKAGVLGIAGYWLVMNDITSIFGLAAADLPVAARSLGTSLVTTVLWLALGLGAIAGLDVPIQAFRRNARLRMSKQEIKEEMRQSEGAPELKQAVRQRQHDILMGSARKAVLSANVILTNPTHFAIALRYDPDRDFAPMVVARGCDETAQAIKMLAKEHKVPTLEYPALTRAIYFTTRAGQPIAEDLYLAVATILAFVFNLDRAMADGIAPPSVLVPEAKRYDAQGKRAV